MLCLVVSSRYRRINVLSHPFHGHRQRRNTLCQQRMRMNSRIANPGTMIDESSNLRFLLQHTWQKLVNLLQLEMKRAKLREKLEASEISERAQ